MADALEIQIEEQLKKPLKVVDPTYLGRAARLVDAPGRYIEFCKSVLPHHTTLDGIKLVVDCANGATCRVAPHIFRELGAKVFELSVNPDGFNINDQCGSTHMQNLQKAVLEHHADLGIAFDGDGDRVLMVDHKGQIVDGDQIIYIIAKSILLTKQGLNGGVAGTQMSNMGLEVALEELGLKFARSAVGDRHVLELLQKNGWILGGESSGHIISLDVATTGDGIIAALRVLSALSLQGKSLQELTNGMHKYPQTMINVPRKNKINPLTQHDVKKVIAITEKKLAGRGRVLVRLSGTESLVRVMLEGENGPLINELAANLATVVEKEVQ